VQLIQQPSKNGENSQNAGELTISNSKDDSIHILFTKNMNNSKQCATTKKKSTDYSLYKMPHYKYIHI